MASRSPTRSDGSSSETDREFDAQWQAWRRSRSRKRTDQPQLADHLSQVLSLPDRERPDVLIALVKTDLRHRIELDEFPTLEDYLRDLPAYEDEVRAAFHQMRPFDDYLLTARLGSGGMGEVYRAQHLVLGTQVALKILKSDRLHDESSIARFRQEVTSIGKLEHQHIVRARDAREIRGHQLLVMDYVEGCDLAALVRSTGALPIGIACEIVRQAAEGLAHAHDQRIIHRDIKPSNIILSRRGIVKLLDFGLAKLKQEGEDTATGLTQAGLMGTVDYMAPEQFDDASRVDTPADIYSLGCTLYHLLVERAPFANTGSSSLLSKQRAHCEAPIPSVRAHLTDCPEELETLLASMMAKQPSGRPSAAHVAQALTTFASATALNAFVREKLALHNADETLPLGPRPVATETRSRSDTRRATATKGAIVQRLPNLTRRRLILGGIGLTAAACASIYGGRRWSQTPNVAARQTLVPLPSLSGGWWFREMPWLTPRVRSELAAAALRGDATIANVPMQEIVDAIHSGADVDATERILRTVAEELSRRNASSVDSTTFEVLRQANEPDLTEDEWKSMLFTAAKTLQREPDVAASVHLRALILHELADYGTAKELYQKAIDLYGQDAAHAELRWLAHCDRTLLLTEMRDTQCLESARKLQEEAQTLSAETQIWAGYLLANSQQVQGNLAGALQQATANAEIARQLPASHPLASFALESLGWSQIDNLRLKDGRKTFSNALDRRRADAKNVHAKHYLLHDRQALIMCQYFLAEPAASEELLDLVDEFDAARQAPGLAKRVEATLNARFPNTCERLGDCLLFCDFSYDRAAAAYQRANAAAVEKGIHLGRSASLTVRIRYKCVIARVLANQLQEAADLYATATELKTAASHSGTSTQRTLLPQELKNVRLYAATAKAFCEFHPPDKTTNLQPLVRLLEQRSDFVEKPGKVNRDEMGLLLIAAKTVFEHCDDIAMLEATAKQLLAVEKETSLVGDALIEQQSDIRHFFSPYWQASRHAIANATPDMR